MATRAIKKEISWPVKVSPEFPNGTRSLNPGDEAVLADLCKGKSGPDQLVRLLKKGAIEGDWGVAVPAEPAVPTAK